MKRFLSILLSLIGILGFTTNVFASASSSITTNISGSKYEYIDGVEVYYNYASSYPLYVLDNDTYFNSRTTLSDPEEANEGFAYIINNSNVTSSSYKNYYIAQVAILWYQDYLNGNDNNISASLKKQITNSTGDTISYYINKLVNGAKAYNESNSSIKIIDKEVTFTKSGSYYYSNVIDVETDNLRNTPSVNLKNAPNSTSVVSNSLTKDGNGSFQIRIPASSLSSFNGDDFLIEITGSGYDNTVYKYTKYGTDDAIYGRVYSTTTNNEEASIIATIDFFERTNIRISVIDRDGNYISGLKYNIYSGDCSDSTCYSSDLVETFTTNSTYKTLSNTLSSGEYTLVNKSNYEYYGLPEKTVINITNTTSTQEFIIDGEDYYYDDNDNNSNYIKKNVTIYNSLDDSTNIIKIYNNSDTLVDSFRGNKTSHKISLYPGNYYIVDTDETLEVYFEVTGNGNIYVTEGANKIKRSSIDLDNYYLRYTTDAENTNNNTNNTTNNDNKNNVSYDESGNIHIGNLDGVDSIDITNKIETTTDVKVEWLSNIIDCPITSLSSTIKYVIGAIVLAVGAYLVIKNVKKQKDNI